MTLEEAQKRLEDSPLAQLSEKPELSEDIKPDLFEYLKDIPIYAPPIS